MANEKDTKKEEKKEINYHAGTMPKQFANFEVIETNPGFNASTTDRYQVYIGIPVPKGFKFPEALEKASQDMYGISFLEFCQLAGKQIATRPAYKEAWDENGKLKDGGHKMLQDLAVNYRPGRISGGATKKVQAKLGSDLVTLAEKLDKTPEQLMVEIAKLAKQA